jgi:hypothetical protein
MHDLGATLMECGATVVATEGVWRQNQCLYLSLAAAVAPSPTAIQSLADALRVDIEGAVLCARPNWAASDLLGNEVAAFADFLVWGLSSTPHLRNRAVAVYDARAGTCEIIRPSALAQLREPVVGLWFGGAHYRWVRWRAPGPSLEELLAQHTSDPSIAPQVHTLVTLAA